MRVQSVQPMHNGGYFHPHGGPIPPMPPKREEPPAIHVAGLIRQWKAHTMILDLMNLGEELGVSSDSLITLDCCWAGPHKAYAFPMRNGEGDMVGIRLRSTNGRKWSVRGSHQGLFIGEMFGKFLFVCEGPTDTAAAIDLGLCAVGRPSCSGGVRDLCVLVRRMGFNRVVIVSDNDKPGLSGAEVLSNNLPVSSATLVLPAKDMREFVRQGGTAQCIKSLIKSVIWNKK